MNLKRKAQNVLRMLVQRYGSERAKRNLWNEEFSAGKWNFLDATGEESVRSYVEKYAEHGAILDLGCGSGTTGIELDPASYTYYTGVDISDVAIEKAKTRAREAGVADRREHRSSDILTYVPERKYNVILFGDSIYYIPFARIASMLSRYAAYLTDNGVFVVRLFDVSGKRRQIVDIIESHSSVVERHQNEQTQVCNIVFRPKAIACRLACPHE
jgi:SAM-dependent methyltransferase